MPKLLHTSALCFLLIPLQGEVLGQANVETQIPGLGVFVGDYEEGEVKKGTLTYEDRSTYTACHTLF